MFPRTSQAWQKSSRMLNNRFFYGVRSDLTPERSKFGVENLLIKSRFANSLYLMKYSNTVRTVRLGYPDIPTLSLKYTRTAEHYIV